MAGYWQLRDRVKDGRPTTPHGAVAVITVQEAMDAAIATIKTPFGEAKRCRAKCKSTGTQCRRAARRNYPVCSVHGAGGKRRELAGTRKSPRLGKFTTGLRATPATLDTLAEVDAVFAAARAEASEVDVMDPRPVLEDLFALRRVALQRGCDDERLPALLAILNTISTAQERAVRVEQRLANPDSITVGAFRRYMAVVAEIVADSVPPSELDPLFDRLMRINLVDRSGAPAAAFALPGTPTVPEAVEG